MEKNSEDLSKKYTVEPIAQELPLDFSKYQSLGTFYQHTQGKKSTLGRKGNSTKVKKSGESSSKRAALTIREKAASPNSTYSKTMTP